MNLFFSSYCLASLLITGGAACLRSLGEGAGGLLMLVGLIDLSAAAWLYFASGLF
jgi:hypothetical protein